MTRTVWEPSSPRVEILIGPFVMIRFISNLKKWSLQRQSGDASRGAGLVEIPERCYEIPVEIVVGTIPGRPGILLYPGTSSLPLVVPPAGL